MALGIGGTAVYAFTLLLWVEVLLAHALAAMTDTLNVFDDGAGKEMDVLPFPVMFPELTPPTVQV